MSTHEHPSTTGHTPDSPGHETRDVTFSPVVWSTIVGAVVVILVFVAMWWMHEFFLGREAAQSPPANPLSATYGRQVPPEPRLQSHPVRDLKSLHAQEDAVLNSYAWVDRDGGVVRIPIERAMQLLLDRGLPVAAGEGE